MPCKSLVQTVANTETFLHLGKKSKSNSCCFNAGELSAALTVSSVFSKILLGWSNYCWCFTSKSLPGLQSRREVTPGERGSQDLPPGPCFCTLNHQAPPRSSLCVDPGPTPQLAAGLGRLRWALPAAPGATGTARSPCPAPGPVPQAVECRRSIQQPALQIPCGLGRCSLRERVSGGAGFLCSLSPLLSPATKLRLCVPSHQAQALRPSGLRGPLPFVQPCFLFPPGRFHLALRSYK